MSAMSFQEKVLVRSELGKWRQAVRQSGKVLVVTNGCFDLLHVALALTLGATEFLTFDARQATLAKAAGLKVKP